MRFKVKSGIHVETTDTKGGTKTYIKGQIVETDKDLDKAFPGKFIVMQGAEGASDPESNEEPAPKKPKKEIPAPEEEDEPNLVKPQVSQVSQVRDDDDDEGPAPAPKPKKKQSR